MSYSYRCRSRKIWCSLLLMRWKGSLPCYFSRRSEPVDEDDCRISQKFVSYSQKKELIDRDEALVVPSQKTRQLCEIPLQRKQPQAQSQSA